jgi:hypothetical protein
MMSATPPPLRRRSLGVTVLAWLVIVGSGLLLPVSALALLFSLAPHPGTKADLMGVLTVIVAPPVTLLAGVGFLLRWRGAWFYLAALAAFVLVVNLLEIVRGPQPERVTISATGTRSVVSATSITDNIPPAVAAALALGVLFLPAVRREF